MNSSHPAVSIIIVNWNGGEFLRRSIQHVRDNPPSTAYEIIVVDNCSTDDSLAWLRSEQAALGQDVLRLIENQDNAGFPRANNQAIAVSRAPLVFLLNPDAEVYPGAIDRLMRLIESNPRIGACSPRLLNTDGTLQRNVWVSPPTPWTILMSGSPLARLLPRRLRGEILLGSYWDHSRQRRIPFATGTALLIRKSMLDEIGALDERFPMYAEDHEFCLRINRTGWQLWFEPSAEVLHHGGRSAMQRWSSGVDARQAEAFYRFQKTLLPRYHVLGNLLATWCVLEANAWLAAFRNRSSGEDRAAFREQQLSCKQRIRQLLERA